MRIASTLAFTLLVACGGGKSTSNTTPPPDDPREDHHAPDDEPPPDEVEKRAPPPPPEPLTLEQRVAFHDGCFESFLAEEPDFFKRCYTETSSEELVDASPAAQGVAAIEAANLPFWEGFKLEGKEVLTIASGTNAATVAVMRATNDADFMGMPATNKTAGQLMIEVQDLDDQGRHGIVRTYIDMNTFMVHLGMGPKGAKSRKVMDLPTAEPTTVFATGSETETKNLALLQAGIDLVNKHDAKGLAKMFAKDAVVSDQAMPADIKGTKNIEKMFKSMFTAFPDAKEELMQSWAAGDYVFAETVMTGTNKGKFPEMGIKKATKKPVRVRTAHVFKLVDGKVTEHWRFTNGMAVAMQLGLIAPPPAPPADGGAAPSATK